MQFDTYFTQPMVSLNIRHGQLVRLIETLSDVLAILRRDDQCQWTPQFEQFFALQKIWQIMVSLKTSSTIFLVLFAKLSINTKEDFSNTTHQFARHR